MDPQTDIIQLIKTLPSLDEYISASLTPEHHAIYAVLLRERYTNKEKFPVDFEVLLTHLGYTRKDSGKKLLIKICKENIDFEVFRQSPENPLGGRPKENIWLTLDCAQMFSLQSQTEQGKQMASFFIQAVKCLQDYHVMTVVSEKQQALLNEKEKTLLQCYSEGESVTYLGQIGESLIKYGYTDIIRRRTGEHKRDYGQFSLLYVCPSIRNREVERQFENHPLIQKHRTTVERSGVIRKEVIELSKQLSLERCVQIMKELAQKVSENQHTEKMKELENQETTRQFENQEKKWVHEIEMKKLRIEEMRLQIEAKKLGLSLDDMRQTDQEHTEKEKEDGEEDKCAYNRNDHSDPKETDDDNQRRQKLAKYFENRCVRITTDGEYFSVCDMYATLNGTAMLTARVALCNMRKDQPHELAKLNIVTKKFAGRGANNVPCVHFRDLKTFMFVICKSPEAKKVYKTFFKNEST